MHRLAEDYPHIAAVIPTPQSSVVTNMVQESVSRWEVPVVVIPAASDLEKYDAFAVSFWSYLLLFQLFNTNMTASMYRMLLVALLSYNSNWMSLSLLFIWYSGVRVHHVVHKFHISMNWYSFDTINVMFSENIQNLFEEATYVVMDLNAVASISCLY